jgi:hypothetical protein
MSKHTQKLKEMYIMKTPRETQERFAFHLHTNADRDGIV